jgi:class 3 adenylate cyclase
MMPPEAAEPGERKIVTVVFADLVGSTALGDEEDPERTRRLLERFYDSVTRELEASGATIEKFAGDAVMAVFGSPVAQEDHPDRALRAALAMRGALATDLGAALALRIGVNSGEVLVGAARVGSSFVSGDTVNVAARLEQAAAPGQILVGARTVASLRSEFPLGPPIALEVKGKREPVVAHELVTEPAQLARATGIPGATAAGPATSSGGTGALPRRSRLGTTFVGRKSELEQVETDWRRVTEEGEARLLMVIGEPGIGKTSLVRELLEWLGRQAPTPVRRSGRCLAYGQGSTYWPLAEVLREHIQVPRTATAEEVLGHLQGREILGLTFGLDVAGNLHPLAARERLHDAWVVLLEEMAAETPAVVVLEDLHWADEPLLDLLEEVEREVRAPVLLVTTARPEFAARRPAWSGRRHVSTIWLEPLSDRDEDSMLRRLLGGEPPPALERLVLERAEGNPFFVEELLASFLDRGLLRRLDGGWSFEAAVGASVPDTVRAVISARLDLLPMLEKAALQAASVAGRTFASAAVLDLLDRGVDAGGHGAGPHAARRGPDFGLLEERGFVRRYAHASAGEREYTFKHALTRDVAYASLPKRRRARLHAEFARRLERIGESGDQFAGLLAHHYYESVRPEDVDLVWSDAPDELNNLRVRAVDWLRRAGELAAARFAIDDGLALLERALSLEPSTETQARIWRAMGRAHALRYAGVEAVEAYGKAAELSGDRAFEGEVHAELALEVVLRYAMFNPMPPRGLVEGWIDRALELAPGDDATRTKALVARAIWSPQSERAADEALEIAERLGDPDLLSHACNARSAAAFANRRYDESIAWAQRRLALADRISDPDHLVDIYSSVIPGLLGRGRFEEARPYAQMHDDAASRLSTHHQVHAVAMKLELEELTGRWDLMRGLEGRAREVVEANVATPCVRNARSLLTCAVADAVVGADASSRELEARAGELEMEGYRGTMAPLRIRLALARREHQVLERLLLEAVPPPPAKNWWALVTEAARLDALSALGDRAGIESEAPTFLVEGTYLEPFALRALGFAREAPDLLERALERFVAMGMDWHAEETRRVLGQGSRPD